MKLRIRSDEPELMDSEKDGSKIHSALHGLKIINKFLGGNRITGIGISEIAKQYGLKKLNILDAGGGSSEILFQNFPFELKIFSLDKNLAVCKEAGLINKNTHIVCGDILKSPFRKKSFDIVHASLFVHHFSRGEIKKLLSEFCCAGKYGVVINDLRRSVFAYYGYKLLSIIIPGGRIVKHDGLISIRRGFKRAELENLLKEQNLNYKISRKFIFRWLIIIHCNERI